MSHALTVGLRVAFAIGFGLVGLTQAQVQWTGATSASWADPANWSAGVVPDGTTDVVIPSVAPGPSLGSSGFEVRDLTLEPGATMTLSIAGSSTFRVTGDLEIQSDVGGTAVLVCTSSGDLYIEGDWTQADADGFVPGSSLVVFDGDTSITAPERPRFYDVTILPTRSLAVGAAGVDVSRDWISTGATVAGGDVVLTGNGTMTTGTSVVPNVVVAGGLRRFEPSTVGTLDGDAGTINVNSGDTLVVTTLLRLDGAQVDADSSTSVLQVDSDVIQTVAVTSSAATDSRLTCAGAWTSSAPFAPTGMWVDMLDGSSIAGSALSFRRLRVADGTCAIQTAVAVTERLQATGGSSTGPGSFDLVGASSKTIVGGAGTLHRVRLQAGSTSISSGSVTFGECRVQNAVLFLNSSSDVTASEFWLESGQLWLQSTSSSLTVTTKLTLESGAMAVRTDAAIEVIGSVEQTGAVTPLSFSSYDGVVRCHETWTGAASFDIGNGWVEMVGASSVIDGTAPSFDRLRIASGETTAQTAVAVTDRLQATGGNSTGPGSFDLVGASSKAIDVGAGTLHRVRLQAGSTTISSGAVTFGECRVQGGTLFLNSSSDVTASEFEIDGGNVVLGSSTARLNVPSVLTLTSGSLGISNGAVVDVTGNVVQSGSLTTGDSGFQQGVLRCHGTWTGASVVNIGLAWVEMAGSSTVITGASPGFELLRLASGATTIETTVAVTERLQATGGSSTGPGSFDLVGTSSKTIVGGEGVLHRVRALAGPISVTDDDVTVAEFEVDGGNVVLGSSTARLNVPSVLTLTSGSLGISNGAIVDVIGNVVQSGSLNTGDSGFQQGVLRCHGTWTGASVVNIGLAWVEMVGTASVIDGEVPAFNRLRIAGGTTTLASPVTTADLEVTPAGVLDIPAAASPFVVGDSGATIAGTVLVRPGVSLRLDDGTDHVVTPTGTLSLVGAPSLPAVLERVPGSNGFGITVDGTLAARHFVVRGTDSDGLLVSETSTVAPAPNDVRDGLFDGGDGVLFDVRTPGGRQFVNLAFEKGASSATENVFRPANALGEIAFLSWSGSFGGEPFEDDPAQDPLLDPDGLIVWVDAEAIDLKLSGVSSTVTKAVSGNALEVSWIVENIGTFTAEAPWVDRVVLSLDTTLGDADDVLLGEFASDVDLVGGAVDANTASVTLPAGLDGEYWLGVITDATDVLDEPGGELNNTGLAPTPILVTPFPQPNLVVQGLVAPATAGDGAPMTVTWNTANVGTGEAVGVWQDRVYLSSDAFFGGDFLVGTFPFTASAGDLPADGSELREVTVDVPAGLSGPYRVIVRTDALNQLVTEITKSDNTTAAPNVTLIEQSSLPDLQVVSGSIDGEYGELFIGTHATVAWTVGNVDSDGDGLGTAYGQRSTRAWLSADAFLGGGDTLIATRSENGFLEPGMDDPQDVASLVLPAAAGDWFVLFEADVFGTIAETDEGNNVLALPIDVVGPGYTATVATAVDVAAASEGPGDVLIPITGQIVDVSDPLVTIPDAEATVRVRVGNTRRVYDVVSDANGDYSLLFEPVPGEAGTFDLYADHPAVVEDPQIDPPQDSFTLVGLDAIPSLVVLSVTEGETTSVQTTLRNPGDATVTGIDVQVVGLPPFVQLVGVTAPSAISAYGTAPLVLEVTATGPAPDPSTPIDVALEVSADVGASSVLVEMVDVPTFVSTAVPDIVASVAKLEADVVKGDLTTLTFTLTNVGGAPATGVTASVPCIANPGFNCPLGSILALGSPSDIGTIAPGQSVDVVVHVTPSLAVPAGTGYAGVVDLDGNEPIADMPFDLLVTSTATGSLVVEVIDELTFLGPDGWFPSGGGTSTVDTAPSVTPAFFAPGSPPLGGGGTPPIRDALLDGEGPKVAGAEVKLFDTIDGTLRHRGKTGLNGEVTFPTVIEGVYRLEISAEQHNTTSWNVEVVPGVTTELERFISFQAVSYSWTVEPTEVEDVYDITIEATFETAVPVPTIILQPSPLCLDLLPGETRQIDVSVTNFGLVSAFGMELFTPDLPGFDVEPELVTIGELGAFQSVVVPLVVQRISDAPADLCNTSVPWGTRHWLLLGENAADYWSPLFYKTPSGVCPTAIGDTPPTDLPPPTDPPPPIPPDPSNPGGGGGTASGPEGGDGGTFGGGGSGGGGPAAPITTPPPPITVPAGCQEG